MTTCPGEKEILQDCSLPCFVLMMTTIMRRQKNYRQVPPFRWVCVVTTKDQVSPQDLLERMQPDDLANVLHTRRLRWHGHVKRSDGWLKRIQKLNPIGDHGRGRPRKTWTEVIDMDRLAMGLVETHPSDRKAGSGRLSSDVRLHPPLY